MGAFVLKLVVWLICSSVLGCLVLYIVTCLFIALAVGGCLLLDLICCVCGLVVLFIMRWFVLVFYVGWVVLVCVCRWRLLV